VRNTNCVGCGRCVDTCPTTTLSYATHFRRGVARGRGEEKS
jgi:formate hydrogenlyase subunit 6/NADH:ubiquinone oxidoreductase subunit I